MKKLVAISILLVLLSTAAFAQFKFTVDANIWTDAVFAQQNTGQMADTDNEKGIVNIFSSSAFNGNELRPKFAYTGANFDASLRWRLDGLVTRDSGFFNQGSNPNFLTLITSSGSTRFDEYWVRGNVANGLFTGYVGNSDNWGKMGNYRFNKFGDFVKGKLDNYGVILPGAASSYIAMETRTDIVNPKRVTATIAANAEPAAGVVTATDNLKGNDNTIFGATSWNNTYAALGLNLGALSIPLVIELASVLNEAGWDLGQTDARNPNAPYSASSIGLTARVGIGKIADFITGELIYKIRGRDSNTWESANVAFPANGGSWNNELGAYVGLDLFSGFALGLGYTAAFRVDESVRVTYAITQGPQDMDNPYKSNAGGVIDYVNPVFNGISLHMGFTGIENLGIFFNSNVSFAWLRGENYNPNTPGNSGGRYVRSMLSGGAPLENTDMKESWFALHNSLGVSYQINQPVSVQLSVTNRLGIVETVEKPGKVFNTWVTDAINIGVSGKYDFANNVSFQAGLAFGYWEQTAEITGRSDEKQLESARQGRVTFAIPIQFKVAW